MNALIIILAAVAAAAVVWAVMAGRQASRAAADTRRLEEANRESIARALEPMAQRVRELERSVRETYAAEAAERFSLADRVRELTDLNRAIGTETRRLTDALKGNTRAQGHWGEIMLENILQRTGLQRGVEYDVQKTATTDTGTLLRPDVVVYYPDGRCLVVDSKVSVSAYLNMLDATDPEQRTVAAKAHVASVRGHINELKAKSYQDLVGDRQCDFVLMFVPHEGAYMAAMQLDDALWQYAFDSRVLIVSPTHLMAVIKLVEQLWRSERQTRNAQEIATEAGKMLDKLAGFIDDLSKIDKALAAARTAYDNAYSKLATGRGNLLGRADRLRTLGAKTK